MYKPFIVFFCTCITLIYTPLFHATEAPTPPDTDAPLVSLPQEFQGLDEHDSHFMTQFLDMLKVLGLVVLAMVLISWVLKRMLNTRSDQLNVSSSIKVLEQRNLTPKSILYLVEINGKKIAIADSIGGITYLGDIPSLSQGTKFSDLLDKSGKSGE